LVAAVVAQLQLRHQPRPVDLQRGGDQRRRRRIQARRPAGEQGAGLLLEPGVLRPAKLRHQRLRGLRNRTPADRVQQRAQLLAPDRLARMAQRVHRRQPADHRAGDRRLIGQLQRARLLQQLMLRLRQCGGEQQVVPHRMAIGELPQPQRPLGEEAGLRQTHRRGARAGVDRDLLRAHHPDRMDGGLGARGGGAGAGGARRHAGGRSFASLCHSG